MHIDDARKEFELRYYQWALEQWQLETEDGFPLLRAIRNDISVIMLETLESLSREEGLKTGRALARRFHPFAAQFLGGWVSADESQLLRKIDDLRRARLASWYGRDVARANLFSRERIQVQLLNALLETLKPVLGVDPKHRAKNVCCYKTIVGPWTINTEIDLGGSSFDLTYHHDIFSSTERAVILARFISVLSWLGISSQTSWNDLSQADIPTLSTGLSLVCKRFLDAAPILLPP